VTNAATAGQTECSVRTTALSPVGRARTCLPPTSSHPAAPPRSSRALPGVLTIHCARGRQDQERLADGLHTEGTRSRAPVRGAPFRPVSTVGEENRNSVLSKVRSGG